ncbi:hypothetical protein ACIP3D_03870 [Streptomyces longwoodensis]|uniref:hypothetical protein n=1 Tax=Streptomyces longwoodensis TaxID=68231 RepID=UPI0038069996
MTAVPLGVPEVPARPIAARRVSRRIHVGPVAVGGGAPVPPGAVDEQDGVAPGEPAVTVS